MGLHMAAMILAEAGELSRFGSTNKVLAYMERPSLPCQPITAA